MDWSEVVKVLGTIVVAAVTALGSGYFGYKQFVLKRQDEREEKNTQSLIDASLAKVKEEMRKEINDAVQQGIVDCGEIGDRAILRVRDEFMKSLEEGLEARGKEGKERFELNSHQIEANSKQLAENSKQIEEILGIVKSQAVKYDAMADSLTALNKVVASSAEAQCNSNYDRLLIVTNKVLKSGKMTISDKTNIKQLYSSWKELGGKDPTGKMDTMYEECMGMELTLDEGI
jgi:hypothetical protein